MNHFSNMYSNLAQQECVFTSVKSVAGISVEYNSPANVFKDEFVERVEVYDEKIPSIYYREHFYYYYQYDYINIDINDGCGNEINFTQERELYLIYER